MSSAVGIEDQQRHQATEEPARILRFWKAVELFSPQKVPRLNPGSRTEPVLRLDGETPLPWDASGWFHRPAQDRAWRFTAYCGVYRLGRVRARLQHHFGRDRVSFDRQPDGESCLFALQLTADGRPLLDTFVLSSCPWAIGRLEQPGPAHASWLSGFEVAAHEEGLRLAERFAVLENDEVGIALNQEEGTHVGRPVQLGDLESEIARIAANLGVAEILQPHAVRLSARQVSLPYQFNADSDDFLNSFFLRDLERLATEAEAGNLSPALACFLSADRTLAAEERCDVRSSLDPLWQMTAPARVPAGRWPASPRASLYFSQQFAVNAALAPSAEPILGINGPPGTGKTTLLRDLIAAVIVQRAQALAALERPELAFEETTGHWQTAGYDRLISLWREELLGFEIVVASANNRAVENVTLEIPARSAVDPAWLGEADYFGDFAARLLQDSHEKGVPAWGLIAARLGSKRNRHRFVSKFWFSDKEAPEPRSRAENGFLHYLQHMAGKPHGWQTAVQEFQTALRLEEEIRRERVAAWQALTTHDELARTFAAAEAERAAAITNLERCDAQAQAARELQRRKAAQVSEAREDRRRHQQTRPGVVSAVFTLGGATRAWRMHDRRLAYVVHTRQKELRTVRHEVERCREDLRLESRELVRISAHIAAAQRELAAADQLLQSFRQQLGAIFPDPAFWLADDKPRELSSPWADETWNRARTRVFLAALHLHRAFLEAVPSKIRNNLHGVIDILRGKVSSAADPRALRSAWATIFFVLPVVSTTFASFDRLFSHLGRESLGWLLIDEAGQAVPQSAAGALWRSRRAVVVGDPRQLEPIVNVPFTAQKALQTHFRVASTWLPSSHSVQSLADRVSRLGTWLPNPDAEEPIWVGTPLRVHRRCADPMFSISNGIAYSGQMVLATVPVACSLPPSSWTSISALESDDHWIPAEGAVTEFLLSDLRRAGVNPADILLISPFRAVARQLKQIGARHGISQAGTIHVSQGREAEVVVLVLGGNPRSPGAKDWASDKPNLLNVAVSRARQRLFIIGNREEWSLYPYFADAAALLVQSQNLPVKPLRGQRPLRR